MAIETDQLHLLLREISPAIWRRLLVRSDANIADLHNTIQLAMGWSDTHLNRFMIHGKDYGVPHSGEITFSDSAETVHLCDFGFRARERFVYEYDFFDQWRLDVRLEKRLPLDVMDAYPRCVGGARACPPEDCGGPWSFMALEDNHSLGAILGRLQTLSTGDEESDDCHADIEAMLWWLTKDKCAVKKANERLARQQFPVSW